MLEFLLNLDRLYNLDESNESEELRSRYIYKNVFHTDLFIRRNYASRARETTKDNYLEALRNINRILSGNDRFLDVTPLKTIIYNENEGSFYDQLYRVEKFGEIFDELIGINKKDDEFESGKKVFREWLIGTNKKDYEPYYGAKVNREELRTFLEFLFFIPIYKSATYKELYEIMNSRFITVTLSFDDAKKYYEIADRIKARYVTYQDLLELAEIYNKYI